MEMPPWVWALIGSGVMTTTITATAALIRHHMNIEFFRLALDKHGIEGLNAARRAIHPFAEARAKEKPPPPTAIQPPPPPLPLPPLTPVR
ncbi:MAG: hypothetical protein ACRDSG_07495 [Pseudonocardiaceae bacterium]